MRSNFQRSHKLKGDIRKHMDSDIAIHYFGLHIYES